MPKRTPRSELTFATAPEGSLDGDAGTGRSGREQLEERGAFAFGRCRTCGWQGPARRSRERARKDLRRHVEDRPTHSDDVAVAELTD